MIELIKSSDTYYLIKTSKGYLTHKGMKSKFSYTTNINLAYTFDDVKQVKALIKRLDIIAKIVTKQGDGHIPDKNTLKHNMDIKHNCLFLMDKVKTMESNHTYMESELVNIEESKNIEQEQYKNNVKDMLKQKNEKSS